MTDQEIISQLRAQVAKLTEEVNHLRGVNDVYYLFKPYGFSRRGTQILIAMARQSPKTITSHGFHRLLKGTYTTGKNLAVAINKIRECIDAHSIPGKVETVHSVGYRTDADLTRWIFELMSRDGDEPNQPSLFPEQP